MRSTLEVRVHERGEGSIDGILELIELAGEQGPAHGALGAMCQRVAAIASADVVSCYVRERGPDGDRLVMRGNVGFPAEAVGQVSLAMGEGLTGMVAECMRPVSVAAAGREAKYKHVPGLGEEQFPSYLGIPLLGGGRVVGVLVLQRREARAFAEAGVALATALAAPFAYAVEEHRRRQTEPGGDAPRSARLRGVPLVGGTTMGRATVVPTLAALGTSSGEGGDGESLGRALEQLSRDLERARRALAGAACTDDTARAIGNLELVLADTRFRGRLLEGWITDGIARGLAGVARDYARVPYRIAPGAGQAHLDGALAERAREVEDLCVLLYAAATGEGLLRPGHVWVADRLGAFIALIAVARRASAIVLDGPADTDSLGARIARAGGVPVMAQVRGLFAWVRERDLVIVDADRGTCRVNPSASSVARFRSENG